MMTRYHSKEGIGLLKYLTFSSSSFGINPKMTFFTYSREAIFQMILVNKIGEQDIILMPSYQCNTVIDYILPFTKNIVFYTINENLSYSSSEIKRKINKNVKMVFFVHYFGIIHDIDESLVQVLVENKIKIVHDMAHSFLSFYEKNFKLERDDYLISSIYKNIPLGVGAIGIGDFQKEQGINLKEFFVINLKKILTNIRCCMGKRTFTYYAIHDNSSVQESAMEFKKSPFITIFYKFLLAHINIKKLIFNKRNISYRYFKLFENSSSFSNVFNEIILEKNVLQAYPIRCEDKILQKKLFDFLKKDCIDIYPWPSYHPMNDFDNLKEKFLLLPLDEYSLKQTKTFLMENLYD